MTQYLFIFSAAAFSYCIICLVLLHIFRKHIKLTERLKSISAKEAEEGDIPVRETKRGLIKVPKYFVPEGLKNSISLSGLDIRVDDFVFLWIFLTLVPGILLYMLTGKTVMALLCAAGFGFFPMALLKILGNRQKKEFEKQLSDALTIISNALRAGNSLPQALLSVTETLPDPINREFLSAVREVRLGAPVTDALKGVAERMSSKDLELLITAVEVQERVGGNLAEIMDTISGTIRDRLKLKRSIGAMTAQGKISGVVVGCLPMALLLIVSIMSPGYMDPLFESDTGKIILVICAVMETAGFFIIRKIVNVKM